MCGFTGFIGGEAFIGTHDSELLLRKMNDTIIHRGPDSEGYWFDFNAKVALGHRRLAIVDLSPAGSQPMTSHTGRFVIVFNGEIYNHLELRDKLEANDVIVSWRGHSDTESLLACFESWGVQKTVEECEGMFAFAVWDTQSECLTLGRDRIGEKPLYFGWQNDTFLFGSEIKALKVHPAFQGVLNRDAITLLLRYSYIPAPYSIYKGINKLLPGYLVKISANDSALEFIEYWSAKKICEQSVNNVFNGNANEAVEELERILKHSIKQQMTADVPLGAFLSGGIDSSTVVALMQAQSDRPIKTFSIGFSEEGYNEAIHAKAVAEHLGTEHTELYVTPEETMRVIPQLAQFFDEPFSDSSQIPTYLVSKMASEYVTVSLSGDGGDELFCGYNRYIMTRKYWNKLGKISPLIRTFFAKAIVCISIKAWDRVNKILPAQYRMYNLGDKMHKASGVLAAESASDLYKGLVSRFRSPESLVINGVEPEIAITSLTRKPKLSDDIEQMMALDLVSYLPDDILTKVDRASMAVSLESRVPFVNHKVVEFAWTLPLKYKLRKGITKWCLKEILYKYVPKSLIDRPKMGFAVPLDAWLRGPLKQWASGLIEEKRLIKEGIFKPDLIRKIWYEHQTDKRNWQHQLWSILMFQLWYEKNGSKEN